MSTKKKSSPDLTPSEKVFFEHVSQFWEKYSKYCIFGALIVGVAGISVLSVQYRTAQEKAVAQRAYLQALEGDQTEQMEALKAVVADHSEYEYAAMSALKIGELYLREGDYSTSIEWFERAEKKSSHELVRDMARENIGAAYEYLGEYDLAMEAYKELTRVRNSFRTPSVYLKMAFLEMSRGNLDRAAVYSQKVIADDDVETSVKSSAKGLYAQLNAMGVDN
ncbi:tetratricopeptide repeat protein [Chitinivibrio alkaliphilus]|uniref:Ancillary SecYEG translocon subunit/Cell division coordinator CpoB TPR domain-containing protein n=1 Tax=Chitinivibrio alkaliphilus ACht1 TaxID=1313304 RepID=U7D556_9BACT|nr:tetratricopeptide repeat protein [Chitinivibrio alkaliphilus]ERP31654.1 hypothetical protein CALK_1518 [Chitinivibrio alkaliphilus ACht1]